MVKLQDQDGVDDNGHSKKNKFTTMSIRFFDIISLKTDKEGFYIRKKWF